jgi:hypothetical protein
MNNNSFNLNNKVDINDNNISIIFCLQHMFVLFILFFLQTFTNAIRFWARASFEQKCICDDFQSQIKDLNKVHFAKQN